MRKDDFVLFLIYKSLIQKKRRSSHRHVVGYMNLTKNHDNRPYSAKRGTYQATKNSKFAYCIHEFKYTLCAEKKAFIGVSRQQSK